MRETFPVKLLLQLLQAPPEKLAAVERILGGQPFPDWQKVGPDSVGSQAASSQLPPRAGRLKETGRAALLAPQHPDQLRCALQKGRGAWALTYDGEQAVFVDRAGMDFVEYLLKHPGEPVHSLTLLARANGQAPVQQRSAALDDADATRRYLREMDRLRAVLDSDDTSELEKQVAEEELAQLEASGACTHHRTIDEASKTAKSVRQAIRRVIGSLAEAKDEQRRPHRILTAFAAHLQKHLLGPSQPGSVATGHLVYEPPAGVVWA